MHRKTKLKIIIIISFIAFINAFYLSYDWIFAVEQTQSMYFLPANNITGGGSFCDINETLSCSAVLSNPLSQIYGIPFPLIALFVYPIIILVALLGYFKKIKNTFKILLVMGLAGIMFNGYFIFQEIFNIGAFCPLCLMCSIIIITIATLSGTEVCKKYIENKKN
ncbi:MAG: vitamin K epoxide reductase family protein [Candidatus Gracilibacteria bacterium]|nr:vitamin K epoxide reductase family protein [Candidatus Gracilibacteria bacterium]